MTSSMLTGDKRWAPARRGGMTVLGKVSVPKPINLPSQRLENHGLDPNVEIVPKGTHSWGSRSSASSPNAWGSPNTDGGNGSPTHLSGRPSSGGTGTRPSTAGSDRGHDPISNAWGPNSRPSSSSGALPSNQTSHTASRPRSAETRPGSSQLSRFAESLSDTSGAWGGSGTTERMGMSSSKNDGFSLTSGDFPTLGSEKDNSGKNVDSQDYGSPGRPGSSAGVASGRGGNRDSEGDVSVNVNAKIGAAGSWRQENSLYGEDGARSNVEKWHADPRTYPNPNIPPQHHDGWHGPLVNNHPGGVWYRGPPGGPPGGPPFGPLAAPGGFPMEPFTYYRPQMPPPALANQQPVPPPGAGPRGSHPKNGDMYRPYMHDAYIRPGMPLRPGFYPTVPYDGYYGPPVGYCNSNERDAPYMGMAMGPTAYNRYPSPDPGNSHGRTSGFGPSGKPIASEQVEGAHSQDTRGPHKVLLKHHDNWEGKDEEPNWDTNAPYPLKGEHPRNLSRENGWRADNKKDIEIDTRRMVAGEGASPEAVDNQAAPMKVKPPENVQIVSVYGDSSGKKFEHADSISIEVLAAPKDSSLIQKIEGLNAKARASDGRQYPGSFSSTDDPKNKFQVGNAMGSRSTNEAGIDSISHEKPCDIRVINSSVHEGHFSAGDKSLDSAVVSGTAISRRPTHGTHGRADLRGKARFNTLEGDGWRKKPQVVDPKNVALTVHGETSSVSHGQRHMSAEISQNSMLQTSGKDDVESVQPVSDPSDSQRVKVRELAKRLKEREKEEEERTREQRAKALAKLEELNRRTQMGEGTTQKLENVSTSTIQNKKDEPLNLVQPIAASKAGTASPSLGSKQNKTSQIRHEESATAAPPTAVTGKPKASTLALESSPRIVAPIIETIVDEVEKCASNIPVETPKTAHKDSVVVHEQLMSSQQDSNNPDAVHGSSTLRVHDSSASKQERTSYRQKLNTLEKNLNEKSSSSSATEASKVHSDIATDAAISSKGVSCESIPNCESNRPVNQGVMAESSAPHRRKNRSGKNKHKVEEALSATSSSILSKETTVLDAPVESLKPRSSETILDVNSAWHQTDSKDANQSSDSCSSLTNEEIPVRTNSQWKSNHPRRTMKNPQGNKPAEKIHGGDAVVWAPVRSQNKTEVLDDANQSTVVEAVVLSSKSDQQVQSHPRNKRAEMERNIPKPVPKELSQQAVVSIGNPTASDEVVERPGSKGAESSQTSGTVIRKMVPFAESKTGDVRQNRPEKVHGSWRQRSVAESTANHRSSRNVVEDIHHQKFDASSMKAQPSYEWDASDGWSMPEIPDTAVNVPSLKDESVTARGKRHPHRGHKTSVYNHNPEEKPTGGQDTEKVFVESTASEMHQMDALLASKENHAAGERSTSHWQPKSQSFSATNQRGSRPSNSMNVGSEGSRTNKKESSQGRGLLPQPDKELSRPHSHHDQSLSKKSNMEEAPSVGHQELRREKRMGGPRGRPSSPIEYTSHSNMDVQPEQSMSPGFRKGGNPNSRFGREHDARGDWSGSGKDAKQQHNVPAIREKQRQNSHYEYQPVGLQNNNKMNNFESSKEGFHNSSGRYRERGHARRGGSNFYGRQTGSVQVDAGYE
ncbi:protein MODIFIER OF SNC1 1 [Mercurialis annua]|uniref:protein MODIFIER OF SNC1 1 n=1 Tax=Mercurialis annua TaxID=3986 RepID=UPI0024AD3185|nr:protein MODIFIER OF SNC1 1 [Mercurialis annua]XP_055961143.1 protein MODIFIER OF SNC1 1 [Mercurialis annua]